MSSSVFIENYTKPVTGEIGSHSEINVSRSPDANLVVVYGKSGVNFDQRGIENLIEEKALSSISVIRLTSPTASMLDEEEEAEKVEEFLRRQAEGLTDEDSDGSSNRNSSTGDEDRVGKTASDDANVTDDKSDEEVENLIDAGKLEGSKKRRRNKRNIRTKTKIQSTPVKVRRERADIVGLTVEEFYPPESAKEVVKEALKLAGVSTFKHTADYEFQLYVIKNDHCYTPFTSPAQMKAKLAEKYKTEKHTVIGRKIVPQTGITMKQLQLKKKAIQSTHNDSDEQSLLQSNKSQHIQLIHKKDSKSIKRSDLDDAIQDDPEVQSSTGDSDFDVLSEESGESDNDRDSDLDFDVNNRKGRKRKDLVTKAKRLSAGKVTVKRQSSTQDDGDDVAILSQRGKNVRLPVGNTIHRSVKMPTPVKMASCVPGTVQKLLSDAVAALPPIPKRPAQSDGKSTNVHMQQAIESTIRRGPIIQKATSTRTQLQASPQSVKEIVINKVMASPKRGFTEIGSLLSQTEKQPLTKTAPTTPTSSMKTGNTQLEAIPSPSKGFMPLGVESAARNKLPSQISIQTHQSSSELAAQSKVSLETTPASQLVIMPTNKTAVNTIQSNQSSSDLAAEQFDLIVSLVKDEMQKTAMLEEASKANENIPKLVKMLENAEQTLESNITSAQMGTNVTNFGTSAETTVDGIDISNAPLLETPDVDEIPDDLLQHVVDLIEDDKTLQEAVEKQVFGGDSSEAIGCVGSGEKAGTMMISAPPPPSLTPLISKIQSSGSPSALINTSIIRESSQPKSIIEMAISNIPSTSTGISNTSSNLPVRPTTAQTLKATPPPVRKEPIQIVRGNGRVITLPPIEAPTTRAKRRAQNQPISSIQCSSSNSSVTFNESSLDSSLHSNSSFTALEPITSLPVEKKSGPTNKRRVSKESSTGGATASKVKKSVASAKKSAAVKTVAGKSEAEADASGSQDDDDDPNKLWCICRQPHNNRFMICCDVCEDWFHGTCVSITKAMGIDMEQNGIDWTCPKCVKLQEEKNQRKITDMFLPKKIESVTTPSSTEQLYVKTQGVAPPISNLDISAEIGFPPLDEAPYRPIKKQIGETKSEHGICMKQPETPSKSMTAIKVANRSYKKKSQAVNTKSINMNISASQVKRQEHKLQVSGAKSSVTSKPAINTEQLHKVVQKSLSTIPEPADPPTYCIVCKKIARANSIYCTDDCIRKHAQNALNAFAAVSTSKSPEVTSGAVSKVACDETTVRKKKPKGLFEEILSMADRKPKVERVHVIERKSGRILTGSNAPTTLNLKKWLQDNQTFEVLQPGNAQAQDTEKSSKQHRPQSLSPVNISGKHAGNTSAIATYPSSQSLQLTNLPRGTPPPKPTQSQKDFESISPLQKPMKQLIDHIVKSSPSSPRPGTPKQLPKYPQQVSIKPDKAARHDSREDPKERKENKATKQRSTVESVIKKPSESITAPSTNSEPIRLNVRRTLKDQLLQRMNELDSESTTSCSGIANLSKLTVEQVEKFVLDTEAEMYEYFSRDTGSRYKAKYRSLMFNIKDRKNHTLFAKICAQQIQPKQLVRMSPEELASQELARWRENEAKHQLEMIKKSELDLLSCAKNYVLKTHKGEEVIEGKLEDCVNLDVTIPVEDVVSVLNSSTVSSTSAAENKDESDMTPSSLVLDNSMVCESQSSKTGNRLEEEKPKAHFREKVERDKEHDRDFERDRDRDHGSERELSHCHAHLHDSDHSRDREKQHKSKDRHRDKTRVRKRSHSHSRSRSRSREKRLKSYHKEDRRDKVERDRDRDKVREKEKERERDTRSQREFDKKSFENNPIINIPSFVNANKSYASSSSKDKQRDIVISKKSTASKAKEAFSLIDQILESTKTVEEAANLTIEKENIKEKENQKKESSRQTNTPPLPTTSTIGFVSTASHASNASSSDDQEPTSTVSIATPPQDPYIRYSDVESRTFGGNLSSEDFWTGNINMVDVASFQIVLQPVVGNSLNLGTLLPDELDVVGRIGPETVWEYISKIKRSPNKEIVIIRLIPASESETAAYTILFQYLENRNRLGVINTVSTQIKDYYIYPLGAGKKMPAVLQPSERVDFYEDPYRPDMLVGVLVRIIGKRHPAPPPIPSTSMLSKSYRRITDTDSFTPPGSPKRKRRMHTSTPKVDEIDVDAIIKAPIATKSHKTLTAPPATVTNDADEPYSPGGSSDDDTFILPKRTTRSDEDELKRKMDELNRQIAAQEMEIAGLLNVESSCFASSSTTKTSTVLANISIPSNLSQILASIKSKPEGVQSQFAQSQGSPPQPLVRPVTNSKSVVDEYNPELVSFGANVDTAVKTSSRLAQLSEEELLSMVPDDMINMPSTPKSTQPSLEMKSHIEEPPPPGV